MLYVVSGLHEIERKEEEKSIFESSAASSTSSMEKSFPTLFNQKLTMVNSIKSQFIRLSFGYRIREVEKNMTLSLIYR
jgi:hypothetical protein